MVIQIMLYILLIIISYLIVGSLLEFNLLNKVNNYIKDKNEKYYEELLKYYEKNKKINLNVKLNVIHKINIALDRAGIPRNIFINAITILFFSIALILIAYSISFNFFKVVILSIIVSIPCGLIPLVIINYIGENRVKKIEKIFLNFLLQLKNYTRINNDIIFAMQQVEVMEPLQSYIDIFLIEVNSGIKFEKAIDNMKEKINVGVFRDFLSNVEYCYIYGGSFTELIDKSYKLISEIQTEKNNRIQETKSARLALYILMFLNVFVYITNIKNNYENYIIMQKTVLGNLILYWNFTSLWILLLLANKVKKLDY